MSAKQAKVLRNQIRQVVEELLPSILAGGLMAHIQAQTTKDLETISKEVRDTLAQLDKRSQAVQDYIVRQVQLSQTPAHNAMLDETK